MTGNRNAWRAPLAGLASVAMLATMGVAAGTANAATVNVTLDANGGVIENGSSKVYDDTDGNGKLEWMYAYENVPTYTGYTFTGWYASKDSGKAVSPDDVNKSGATLYAHWTTDQDAANNKVTFDGAAASYDLPANWTASFITDSTDVVVTLKAGDKLADWQIPSNSDAKYDGWRNTADGAKADLATLTTNSSAPIVLEENPVDDAVVYKVPSTWTASDVQWSNGNKDSKLKGIALPASDPFPTVYYTNNNNEAVKQGTWATDEAGLNKATAADKVAGATLWLTNDEKPAYKATVNYVDADGSAVKSDTDYEYFDGTKYTPFDTSKLSAYEKLDGYTFKGWYATKNTTTNEPEVKLDGAKFEKVFSNATTRTAEVYGEFEADADTVEVTFDPYYDGAEKTVKTLTEGAYFGNDLPVPTRDGYVFQGWYKSTSLNNDANKVTKDTKVADFDSNNDGKTTVYAKWASTAVSELTELLGRENKVLHEGTESAGTIYTTLSYKKFDDARDAVAKQINKDYGELLEAEGTAWKVAAYKDLKDISDEDAAAYLKDLKAAAANLRLTAEAEGAYTDVDALTPHYDAILSLTADGVIKGYPDGTFRGMDGLNRQDFAAYLYRLAGEPEFDPAKATKTFADVDASTPHYKAIMWAASKGIVNGYPDGSFKGMDLINRQDAAAMLYRLAGSPTVAVSEAMSFSDVDESTPHHEAIVWAASEGITRGFPDGTFGGMKTIVRQDAAAFLARTANYGVADYLK